MHPHLKVLGTLVKLRLESARLHAAVPRQLPAVVLLEVVVPEHLPAPAHPRSSLSSAIRQGVLQPERRSTVATSTVVPQQTLYWAYIPNNYTHQT